MSQEIRCPHCDKRLRVPDGQAGKKVRCPGCEELIVVPQPGEGNAATATGYEMTATPPAPSRAGKRNQPVPEDDDEEDEDEEPRSRKSTRSKPSRGKSRWCMNCDVRIPPETTACPVCGKLAEYVDPHSPEARERDEKRLGKKIDDLRFYRLDVVAGQGMAILLAVFSLFCCGFLYFVAVAISAIATIAFAGFLIHYLMNPPRTKKQELLERWRKDTIVTVCQLAASAAVTLGMIAFMVVILMFA